MTMIPDTELVLVVAADENCADGQEGTSKASDLDATRVNTAATRLVEGERSNRRADPGRYTVVLTSDDRRSAVRRQLSTPQRRDRCRSSRSRRRERGVRWRQRWRRQLSTVTDVIGGEAVYDLFLPFAGRVFLSRIHEHNEGDRTPDWARSRQNPPTNRTRTD